MDSSAQASSSLPQRLPEMDASVGVSSGQEISPPVEGTAGDDPAHPAIIVEGATGTGTGTRSVTETSDVAVGNMSNGSGGTVQVPSSGGAGSSGGPTAIPADEGDVQATERAIANRRAEDDGDNVDGDNVDGDCEDDEESDYSYDYEEEDETHYSGFLIPTEQPPASASSTNTTAVVPQGQHVTSTGTSAVAPAVPSAAQVANASLPTEGIDTPNGNGNDNDGTNTNTRTASMAADDERSTASATASAPVAPPKNTKWREPTQAAVSMSLRAEREKTGGRRRLASDLYRIMTATTVEAGFSMEPCEEDSMERWAIKLFGFDEDSNLAKDLLVVGADSVELEMSFPAQYPFEPPFVRVVRPRFKRQTGFVMNGALCMELLTNEGWNPINDIESVIVSVRSLMAVGDGRLQAAVELGKEKWQEVLDDKIQKKKLADTARAEAASKAKANADTNMDSHDDDDDSNDEGESSCGSKRKRDDDRSTSTQKHSDSDKKAKPNKDASSLIARSSKNVAGSYSAAEAKAAYSHLSDYHKSKGWDRSGWWAKKG